MLFFAPLVQKLEIHIIHENYQINFFFLVTSLTIFWKDDQK